MEKGQADHYNYIDYLRAVGMFLVAWPHLTVNLNPTWQPLLIVQWFFNRPLSITQNFGALGVCIFFLISGFLMCEPSRRSPKAPGWYFLYKVGGVLLPLWGAMLTFFLFTKGIELLFGFQCWWSQFSVLDWIKSATLYPYIKGTTDLVNSVLWFLFPLLLFILLDALYRIFSKEPSLYFVIFSMLVIVLCFCLQSFLPISICANLTYIPVMLWGYLINLWHRRSISWKKAFSYGILCYGLMLVGFYQFFNYYYEEEPYMLSAILALLLFIIMHLTRSPVQAPKIVKFLSSISYSFYIIHSLYGGMIISALFSHIPYGLALICGVSVSIIMAYINYRYVERPIKAGLVFFAERVNGIYERH